MPGVPLDELSVEQWKGGRGREPDRGVPVHAASVSDHEGPVPARRPDHQQRVALGSLARPNSAPYTATKHAITGLTKSTALDGRKYDIACGQIDIGNAGRRVTARITAGVLQANGDDRAASRRWT